MSGVRGHVGDHAVLHLGRVDHAAHHRHVDAEALGEAGAAVVEAGVADLVIGADRLGEAERLDPFAGRDAGLVLVLSHEQETAEVLRQLGAAGVDHDDRDACGDRRLDGFREGGGVGDGDHQPVRLGGDDGVDHLRHLGHVEGFGREIFGLDARTLGGVVHAVLDDRPVGVAALAVGDEDDAGVIGGRNPRGRRHQCQSGQQAERRLHTFTSENIVPPVRFPPPQLRPAVQLLLRVVPTHFSTGSLAGGAAARDQSKIVKPASRAMRDRLLKPIVA